MKKFKWIAALLLALALIFSGCPGGGDPIIEEEPDGIDLTEIFSATETTQEKATVSNFSKDTVTFSFTGDELWGELITPEGTPWDASAYTGIKFQYKSTGDVTFFIQTEEIYIFKQGSSDGWGATLAATDWTDAELSLSAENISCPDGGWILGENTPFNKGSVLKLMFQINQSGSQTKKFEIRNFTVVGGGVPSKTALNALITEAETKVEAGYTPASWAPFATALATAKTIQAKTGATSAEITSAITALQTAMDNLVPAVAADKAALNALITTANTKVQAGYTSASWTPFAAALADAKATSAATNATQTEVDAAKTALQTAMDGLVEREEGESVTVFSATLGTGVTVVANEKGITHTIEGGKIIVARDTTNNEFRLQVAISPPVDIANLTEFIIAFDVDGASTQIGANISIYTSDSKIVGIAGWSKSSPASFNLISDRQTWLGNSDLAGTNGLCSGFEIYSDSTGSSLNISSITFE